MGIIPDKVVQQVEFCEAHAPVWAAAPAAAIGLQTSQTTLFTTLTTNARKYYNAAQSAKEAYHAAVTMQNDAIAAAISGPGGAADLIRFIESFAENTASPDAIYGLAQIPAPRDAHARAATGQPTNVSVGLESTGAITLKWKSINAAPGAGTFFWVTRKLAGESSFTLVGTVGEKTFTDDTLVLGTTGATYIIQGKRGSLAGTPSEQIGVQFGVAGAGGASVAVTNATLKMAA